MMTITLPLEHDWIEVEDSSPQQWACNECKAVYTLTYTPGKPLSESWDCLSVDAKQGVTGVLLVCLMGLCFSMILAIMTLGG
jgi:hypothetical protein